MALQKIPAGVLQVIELKTYDKFGNLRTSTEGDLFEVEIDGPSSIPVQINAGDPGSAEISFMPKIPGHYALNISHNGEVVKLANSDGSCMQFNQTCTEVYDSGSLQILPDRYVVVPSTEQLDLSYPYTIEVYFSLSPSTMINDGWLMQKQSPSSGKGHWLGLQQHDGVKYSLVHGVYVGSDTFRIIESPKFEIYADEFVMVGASYDGLHLTLAFNGLVVAEESYDNALLPRGNNQEFSIGKGLQIVVDEFTVRTVAYKAGDFMEAFMTTSRCPSSQLDATSLHFNFNEGDGFEIFDSSPNGLIGLVGLISESAKENHTLILECPDGHAISKIHFANFGVTSGNTGLLYPDECESPDSLSIVNAQCLGMSSCMVPANSTNFETVDCLGEDLSLTVEVTCSPWVDGKFLLSNMFTSTGRDTVVGEVGSVSPPLCPMPNMFLGLDDVTQKFENCTTWNISQAVAGETKYFAMQFTDLCNLDHTVVPADYTVTLSFSDFINATTSSSLPDGVCYPTLGHYQNISGAMVSLANPVTCAPSIPSTALFSFSIPFVPAGGPALLSVRDPLGSVVYQGSVSVSPGVGSSANTLVVGPALSKAEAGIETTFHIHVKDSFGNPAVVNTSEVNVVAKSQSTNSIAEFQVMETGEVGTYDAFGVYIDSGYYNVSVSVHGQTLFSNTSRVLTVLLLLQLYRATTLSNQI